MYTSIYKQTSKMWFEFEYLGFILCFRNNLNIREEILLHNMKKSAPLRTQQLVVNAELYS